MLLNGIFQKKHAFREWNLLNTQMKSLDEATLTSLLAQLESIRKGIRDAADEDEFAGIEGTTLGTVYGVDLAIHTVKANILGARKDMEGLLKLLLNPPEWPV
jgi:hypothetical protein